MKEGIYWGLLTPEDQGEPEMFFRNEAWAKKALDELLEDSPRCVGLVRIVRVRVRFEVES